VHFPGVSKKEIEKYHKEVLVKASGISILDVIKE